MRRFSVQVMFSEMIRMEADRFSVQVMFSVMIRMEAHRFSMQVMFSVMIRMEAQATYACVDDLSSRPCYTQPGVYFSQRQ